MRTPSSTCGHGGHSFSWATLPRTLKILRSGDIETFGDVHALGQELEILVMVDQEMKMCAHIACFCAVPSGEEFCSDSCRKAGIDGVEVACECAHSACPVTDKLFVPLIAA